MPEAPLPDGHSPHLPPIAPVSAFTSTFHVDITTELLLRQRHALKQKTNPNQTPPQCPPTPAPSAQRHRIPRQRPSAKKSASRPAPQRNATQHNANPLPSSPGASPTNHSPAPGPQPGDAGIWASCAKGREAKCTAELRDLFTHYARLLYNTHDPAPAPTATIETSIAAELAALRAPSSPPLFVPLRIDVQCRASPPRRTPPPPRLTPAVVFFRTAPPVDPVALVRRICVDAARGPRRTRFVQRLAPVTRLARASPEGLRRVAEEVLAPHFHGEGVVGRKVSGPALAFRRGCG